MARTWFACILLAAILLGCLSITWLVDKHTDAAAEIISQAADAAEREKFEEALNTCEKVILYWEEHVALLSSFLRHEDSGSVETQLQQLRSFAQSESKESFLAACAQLTAQMEHIRDSERPLLENIL